MKLRAFVCSVLFFVVSAATHAITPRNTVTEELIKPDNAINRRTERDMFEYTGVVHVGSLIGGCRNEIEFVEEGFILTFNNIKGQPAIRHLFRYDNPKDFCIPRNAQ